MPIRNPFARRPGAGVAVQNENAKLTDDRLNPSHPGFEKVDTVGSKASSALSVNSGQDNGEYKMSVVNDSGVYLPPSPTEEKAAWPKKYLSSARNSTDTRNSSVADIEHFSISRESFDSYRRSFDISARSPMPSQDLPARQSLDSHRFPRLPRSAFDRKAVATEPPTVEESNFEDVGLNDDHKHGQPQRKRGLFARFGDSNTDLHKEVPSSQPNNNAVSRFLGRKRGQSQSGQGAELGSMERPKTAASIETQEIH
ncbi:hypothetical protein ACHAQH_000253 [Verticillium albo-atrum]